MFTKSQYLSDISLGECRKQMEFRAFLTYISRIARDTLCMLCGVSVSYIRGLGVGGFHPYLKNETYNLKNGSGIMYYEYNNCDTDSTWL